MNNPDPFNKWGSGYDAFVLLTYPPKTGLCGQAVADV